MKLGFIGLPQSGKFTIFKALTTARGTISQEKIRKGDQLIATVNVPDERVDYLSEIYKPKKTIYSQVEYLLPGKTVDIDHSGRERENTLLNAVKICDGLIHIVKNFQIFGGPPPTPEVDFFKLESEMIVNDLLVAEKRVEKIKLDKKRGRKSIITNLLC